MPKEIGFTVVIIKASSTTRIIAFYNTYRILRGYDACHHAFLMLGLFYKIKKMKSGKEKSHSLSAEKYYQQLDLMRNKLYQQLTITTFTHRPDHSS